MKPVVIIAISVACSIGAVFAILVSLEVMAINEQQKILEEQQKRLAEINSNYEMTDEEFEEIFDIPKSYDMLKEKLREIELGRLGFEERCKYHLMELSENEKKLCGKIKFYKTAP